MTLPAITIPNVQNYAVGKGVVSWTTDPNGTVSPTWVDLGNISSFQLQMNAKTLEHFTSRQGVKSRDQLIPYEFTGTLKFKIEEIIPANIAMAFMGTVASDVVQGMTLATLLGQIQFVGNNSIGHNYTWVFPSVSLMPASQLELIGDNWQEMEANANLLSVFDSATPPNPYFFKCTRTS